MVKSYLVEETGYYGKSAIKQIDVNKLTFS